MLKVVELEDVLGVCWIGGQRILDSSMEFGLYVLQSYERHLKKTANAFPHPTSTVGRYLQVDCVKGLKMTNFLSFSYGKGTL